MSRFLVRVLLVLSVQVTLMTATSIALANDTVHVAITPVRQLTQDPSDPGQEDCLPASVAMALEVFKNNGTIPLGVTVTYPVVRTSFRNLVPPVLVTDELYPTVAVALVPNLTQNSVAADIVQATADGWPDLVSNQINRQVPLIAFIGNWSLLKDGSTPLHTSSVGHAVVVTGIGPSQVTFIDPWDGGEYAMALSDFGVAWQSALWTALVFTNQSSPPNAPSVPAFIAPADGGAVAPVGIVLQWSDVGVGLSYEVEAWEQGNDPNWFQPNPPWQTATDWRVPWLLAVGPTYIWRVRAQDVGGQVSPWSTPRTFHIDASLPPPTAVIPIAVIPTGAWISPADGTTLTSAPLHVAAHASPSNPGDPPIDHVTFNAWWPALGPESGPWQTACTVPASAAQGDVYGCDGSLQGTPPGQVKVSFDVYDQAGNMNLAPNGKRVLTYSVASPPTSLIAYVSPTGDLVISKLDGTNARKLVSGPIARPAWSPDGTRIAYLRLPHTANRPLVFDDQIFGDQIEMVNVDGTHQTVLVPPRLVPFALPGIVQYQAFVRIRWASDSSAIYYLYAFGNPGGKGVIRHDLAPSAEHNLGSQAFGHDFDIARDGTLALVDYENAGDHAGSNLYLLLSNGTTRYIVSNAQSRPGIEGPTWSPDGMTIATIIPGVYVTDRNGRSRTIIDSVRGEVTAVSWSPDGARLAFAQGSSLQGSSIWSVSTSGGTPMKLFSGSDPSWGPATVQ